MSIRLSPHPWLAAVTFRASISPVTVEPYVKIVKRLKSQKKIKGVIFSIDSPGGDAAASEFLMSEIASLNSVKSVYAYTESMAASGGYYVACGAGRIYAPPNAVIGSIGVITGKPVIAELADKIGLLFEVLTEGKHKDMYSFHRKYSPEERDKVQYLLGEIYERFVEVVANSRRLSREGVKQIATGELFSAQRALALGLIDGVKGYSEVVDDLARETKVDPKRVAGFKPRKPVLARLIGATFHELVSDLEYKMLESRIRY